MKEDNSKYIVFIGLGLEIIGILMGTVWLGSWFDKQKLMGGYGSVALPMIGLALWLIQIIVMVNKLNKDG